MKHAFDKKIGEMCHLLDGQIQQMDTKYPHTRIVSLPLTTFDLANIISPTSFSPAASEAHHTSGSACTNDTQSQA